MLDKETAPPAPLMDYEEIGDLLAEYLSQFDETQRQRRRMIVLEARRENGTLAAVLEWHRGPTTQVA